MQLRNARLCLDCEEIHDGVQCPMCASETFAFIKRWVPAPERRAGASRTQEEPGKETVEVYRAMLHPAETRPGTAWRLVKGGAVSLAFLAAAGWLWQRSSSSRNPQTGDAARSPSKEPTKESSQSK